ncbi:hypothetical protein LEP1GSC204_2427 [Leptospira interrogans serovar Copenhageni str. M20]|uniref:Uncharacterized protein n=4 Tax=Leptospira interrogans TaxID=173 RepID=A0A829CU83_LEPIR|nr:hypothetical protein LEP1GSC104_3869 [Leptospira interrogans str. UI 12621]EKO97100.1 hypothetical protein LEP1GSC057_2903 [Leptospira interrogans str. Brem 329]EKQ37567.1 hypothetical protein LEP1GSC025_4358 [Leptospira interrogans str. 2002000621]EKR16234.1 hypothetical protein LEP1GSC019_2023 [Leptospira interrogans serovar Pyrogenes str. 2006006960]EMF73136.1 hypothetical protein LEP1GSC148_2217 [Leptospira interrogans serovar Canicola str. LT1962]EMG23192.1 hypothetical protein LEP1GSC
MYLKHRRSIILWEFPIFFKLTVQLLYRAFNQNSFQFISGKNTGRASLKLKNRPVRI